MPLGTGLPTMRALMALVLVAATLAGCSSAPEADPDPTVDFEDLDLEATETTGVIRGIVVDEAIRPIANVSVVARGGGRELTASTTAEGTFGFDGLEPGTYFLSAGKLGYASSQGSAEVIAGVAEPPISKLQLVRDVANLPFNVLHKWEGFLECGLSVIALCGVGTGLPMVGNVTQDRFSTVMTVEGVPLLIQSEAIWATTTAASNELWLWHSSNSKEGGGFNGTRNAYAWRQGPSPLIMTSNATEIEESEFGTNNDVFLRMFTGSISGTRNPTDPEGCYPGGAGPDVYCGGVGYSIQQTFTVYTTSFFGYLPPEGWTFHEMGTAPPPA
jgi:hypothetical protein